MDSIKEADFRCKSCDLAKAVRRPNNKPIQDPDRVLDRLEGDTFKISPTPHNRRRIGLIIVDQKSRYRWLILLKSREATEVVPAIQGLFRQLKNQYGRYPIEFHYDGGTEACNKLLGTWAVRKGVRFTTSNPYTHEQNGLPECSIRVVVDRLRATIIATGLPKHLWCYVITTVVNVINHTAVTSYELTLHQLLFDQLEPYKAPHIPDLSRYRAISCDYIVVIPYKQRV